MTHAKPLPKINADTQAFWDGCREHILRIQKCGDCGQLRWPPAFLCPNCLSTDTRWITASGKGTVYSFAVYHVAFDPAFREDLPYVVALVALEEGPHILSNIIKCDPHEVTCDMPVEVIWDEATESVTLPKFRPADPSRQDKHGSV
ncbi:MAG: hypothetical protein A4E68_00016 [Syntrophaceae bacterium PtaB.Bin095]|nr:MAG: hypothetical protein A4E68_00016 [Syntrophaceae bacterium PtaB.Bin095]